MINVDKLREGIVIDHIQKGRGYQIFSQLGLDKIDAPVVLLRNIPSRKMGQKDLIKIETDLALDLRVLGLIAPNATVNYVKDGVRVHKEKSELPPMVEGILRCKNPRCITCHEAVENVRFYLSNPQTRGYRCEYCDAVTSL